MNSTFNFSTCVYPKEYNFYPGSWTLLTILRKANHIKKGEGFKVKNGAIWKGNSIILYKFLGPKKYQKIAKMYVR